MKNKFNMGKNFLNNINIINKFIDLLKYNKCYYFIEIGPGFGKLTEEFIKKKIYYKKIFLIELDYNLYLILKNKFLKNCNIIILNMDARYLDIKKLYLLCKNKFIVFGSIPYYATISIISNLYKYINYIYKVYFIVQYEFAKKISYQSTNFSKFGLINKLFFKTNILINKIDPKSFYPIPKVYSSLIEMNLNINKKIINNKNIFLNFKKIVNIIFSKKRKILKNSLFKIFKKNYLIKLKINPKSRPQEISLYKYYLLSKNFK